MYLSDIEADEEQDHDRRKFECIECGTDLVLSSPSPLSRRSPSQEPPVTPGSSAGCKPKQSFKFEFNFKFNFSVAGYGSKYRALKYRTAYSPLAA